MSDLDSLFDSQSDNLSLRLFTPTKIDINETDTLDSLGNELERINIIYLKDFSLCCNELINKELNELLNELYLLRNEQSLNLKRAYNASKCNKDLNLMKSVSEAIQKMEVLYTKMIVSLYLPI